MIPVVSPHRLVHGRAHLGAADECGQGDSGRGHVQRRGTTAGFE